MDRAKTMLDELTTNRYVTVSAIKAADSGEASPGQSTWSPPADNVTSAPPPLTCTGGHDLIQHSSWHYKANIGRVRCKSKHSVQPCSTQSDSIFMVN